MSRSITSIQNSILASIASNPVLTILNSTSQAALYTQIAYVVAASQAVEESLNDSFVTQIEGVVNVLAPATAPWIQQQAFNFQYNSSNPQIIQFSTASFAPYYPIVNPSYRIVTNCAVSQQSAGVVAIKVASGASGSAPQPLTSVQLSALNSYFQQIKPCGINYFISSIPADRLYAQFQITAYGAYSGTLTTNLLNAYNAYLSSINFGGTITVIGLLMALYVVPGIIDIKPVKIVARPNSTAFGGGTIMVNGSTIMGTSLYGQAEYTSASGYFLDESSPNDFLSNLAIPGMLNYK